MKIYRVEHTGSVGSDGLSVRIAVADEVEVNGRAMVARFGTMFIDERDKWVDSRAAALEQAAGIVDGVVATLVSQSAELRRQAAEATE